MLQEYVSKGGQAQTYLKKFKSHHIENESTGKYYTEEHPSGPWSRALSQIRTGKPFDEKECARARDRILGYLHENEIKNPDKNWNVSRDEMLRHLNVKENLIDFNIHYLKGKHLINLRETPNSPWLLAKITAFGIDKVESRYTKRAR